MNGEVVRSIFERAPMAVVGPHVRTYAQKLFLPFPSKRPPLALQMWQVAGA